MQERDAVNADGTRSLPHAITCACYDAVWRNPSRITSVLRTGDEIFSHGDGTSGVRHCSQRVILGTPYVIRIPRLRARYSRTAVP